MTHRYARLYEPTSIGKMKLKNRFAMAPLGALGLGDADGGFTQRGIEYYTARARGGTGLIITGITPVANPAESFPTPSIPSAVVNPGHFVRTGRELVERIHAYDSKVMLQVGAGFGRVMLQDFLGGRKPVAPSAIPYRWADEICREMTKDEINQVVQSMAKAGMVAKKAGFDGLQIHAVHEGYLLDQFAIAMFNQRTDEYGGSLDNRLRFTREILDAIKNVCGDDFPVTLRFSPKSFIKDWKVGAMPGEVFEEKGRDLPEGIDAARLLVEYGYDALDIDVGSYDSWYWSHPPMYHKKGMYIPYAKAIREAVDIPVICAGRMDDPDIALAALEDGALDIVSLGRPLLADEDYVNKLWSGKRNLIRPCISCQEGCMGRIHTYAALNCAVNPQCSRETDFRLLPTFRAKKVMIVGGGVAGCEAARVLKTRGHEPVIYERGPALGGVLIPGGAPDFKEDDHALIAWYEATLADLGVEIHLDTEVTAAMVEETDADEIIVATGSKPNLMELGNGIPVLVAADVLTKESDPGKTTVIIGGGLVGCELAMHLTDNGVKASIVERESEILETSGPLCHANHDMLAALVPYKGIETYTSSQVARVTDTGVVVVTDGVETEVPADSVILSVGYASDIELYEAIKSIPKVTHILGDAREVSNIMYAIWDAFEITWQM